MNTMQRRLTIELNRREREEQERRWNNTTPHPMLYVLMIHASMCIAVAGL